MHTSVMTDLASEWTDLVNTAHFCDRLDEWAKRWPEIPIAHLSYSDENTFPTLTASQADVVFLGLITDWQRNHDYEAGRFVLQCMLLCVDKVAFRCVKDHVRPYEVAIADALAGMWEAISTHNLAVQVNIAQRLMFNMLESVSGHLALAELGTLELPVGFFCFEDEGATTEGHDSVRTKTLLSTVGDAVARSGPPSLPDHLDDGSILGPLGDVLEVIHWGLSAKILSPKEAALLTRMYAPDPELPEYEELAGGGRRFQRRVADEMGLSYEALRQAASRAVRKLARAVVI